MSRKQGVPAATVACVRLLHAGTGQNILPVLQRFSPKVANVAHDHNSFRLDVSGMVGLYPSHGAWAQALGAALTEACAPAAVAVGFSAFAVLMRAHAMVPPLQGGDAALPLCCLQLTQSPEHERALVAALPIARAPLPVHVLHLAQELGLRTLGCFVALSEGQVAQTLGIEALALHKLAHQGDALPLETVPTPEPCTVNMMVEPADDDSTRLLFACKALLPELVFQAQQRRAVLSAIDVTLVEEAPSSLCPKAAQEHVKRIEAGRPGRQEAPWLTLMRLALESWPLQRPVQEVRLRGHLQAPQNHQLQLWPQVVTARDEALTQAAISALRARFGHDAVTCAALLPSHLPETQFCYQPAHKLCFVRAPGSSSAHASVLVRRLLSEPKPLPQKMVWQLQRLKARSQQQQQLGHLRAVHAAPPQLSGPFRLSHGWWQAPCDRDYYYLPQNDGALLWIFYDRRTKEWCLHGHVD